LLDLLNLWEMKMIVLPFLQVEEGPVRTSVPEVSRPWVVHMRISAVRKGLEDLDRWRTPMGNP
jgi:hypothetical protein